MKQLLSQNLRIDYLLTLGKTFLLWTFLLLGFLSQPVFSQESDQTGEVWSIGVREEPPFAFKDKNGEWTGLSIDSWEQIANELELEFVWKELSEIESVAAIQRGELNAAIAIRVGPELEKAIDFTHPVESSGFGIVIRDQNENKWWTVLASVFSVRFLTVLLILILIVFVVGLAVWLVERKSNDDQFGNNSGGIGSGFWWAAVTLTTVGYGDKTPVSISGRVVALIWMFASIFLISAFTAAITTALHLAHQTPKAQSITDLRKISVGVKRQTPAAEFLNHQGIGSKSFSTTEQAIKELGADHIDAVFGEAPQLHYFLAQRSNKPTLKLVSTTINRFHYAIVLPRDSPWRKKINLVLLRQLSRPEWQFRLEKYAGN